MHFLLPLTKIVDLSISKPFRGNYKKYYYISSKYLSTLLHVKLNEESNGINFEVICLVCGEQLTKTQITFLEEKATKHKVNWLQDSFTQFFAFLRFF
jgi:hypothetical protein